MNNKDLISVVIPAYNAAPYITECLESVLSQDYRDLEVIVVDDASSDGTDEMVQKFRNRVEYIRLSVNCGGPARPRNVGIRFASGSTVALFDSDDVMLPGKLTEQMLFLKSNPDIPFVFSNFRNFTLDRDQREFLANHKDFQAMSKIALGEKWYRLPSARAYETLISDTYIGTSGVLFRKKIVTDIGGFDESVRTSEDVDFFFRVARSYDLGFIDRVFHKRRLHANNISSKRRALHGMLTVYTKQKSVPMSPQGYHELDRLLASVLFSIGYAERLAGAPLAAVRHYLKSWWHRKRNYRIFLSIVRALIPIKLLLLSLPRHQF